MKRMLKSKEGISPILATLLLIVIAVAAVVVTYAWVMTFTSSQTGRAGKMIEFDSAVINATSNILTVYVRNTGTEQVTLDKVFINGYDRTTFVTSPEDFATAGCSLPVDDVVEIRLNGTQAVDFTAGVTYKVKVAGPGVYWEEDVEAA
ncbi:MAG: archaellin/type IV pilin N-terminal domain-containing protein [Candidatus Bathyarchaeaceae archaeon]